MDSHRLSELRALADAATPGPWVTFDASGSDDDDTLPHILMPASMRDRPQWNEIGYVSEDYPDDAVFIAASRSAVPELLDHVDRLTEVTDERVERLAGWIADQYEVSDELRYYVRLTLNAIRETQ